MSEWRKVKIGAFLHRYRQPVQLESDKDYALVTIRTKHKGVVLREMKKGGQIGSNMSRIKKGQFILSGIDARHGAFGIVPDELDGAIVTNDFWCFDVDENIVKRDFFYWLTTTQLFLDACIKSSKGETQRVRLQKDAFYNFEFNFPPVEKQAALLTHLQTIDTTLIALSNEQLQQKTYIAQLRQSILQEAIEGKLTADWRAAHPVCAGDPNTDAAALLSVIQAEKRALIASGKLKKEKPLAPITHDEMPFALPEGWVWVQLITACESVVDCHNKTATYQESGIPLVRTSSIRNMELNFDKSIRYVSEETYKFWSKRCPPQPGDILFTREAPMGEAAIIPEGKFVCMGQRIMLFRVGNKFLSEKYLLYAVQNPTAKKIINSVAVGSGVKHLRVGDVERLPIPLPPLAEQHAIVERVDRLLASVSALEQQVAERQAYARQLMQAVLQEAFAG